MRHWSSKVAVFCLRIFARFLACLPHRVFLFLVDVLAYLFRLIDSRRYQDAMSNLNFIYRETKTQEEKHLIILRCYRNFAFILLQALRSTYFIKEKHFESFDFENFEYLSECLKGGSFILISAHFGYWEAIGSVLPQFIPDSGLYSLGRLTQFRAINELIIESRQAYGVTILDKKGALKHLLKLYTKPKQVVGIIVDQNISEGEGVWVEFFGKKVTHTPIASILSRRFNIPILPIFIDFNEDYTRFKVSFYRPFLSPKSEDMQVDILRSTQMQADLTQEAIEKNPSSYFWFHKRFKSKYPHIYR